MKGFLAMLLLLYGSVSVAQIQRQWPQSILADVLHYGPETPARIPLQEIKQACARINCIPALTNPDYLPAHKMKILRKGDLLLSLSLSGSHWAYPLKIMRRHEIVNDTLAGVPVVVTYCPLCGSGVAFDRRVAGRTLHFRVSGLLHENDLLMIDLESATLWQQFTGEAIVGPMAGMRLRQLPLSVNRWDAWKAAHPDGHVLSNHTGYAFSYRSNPYNEYEHSGKLLFPVSRQDARLRRKQPVLGIEVGERSIAFEPRALKPYLKTHAELVLLDGRLQLQMGQDGSMQARLDGQSVPLISSYWFAWYSFHPQTQLWKAGEDL